MKPTVKVLRQAGSRKPERDIMADPCSQGELRLSMVAGVAQLNLSDPNDQIQATDPDAVSRPRGCDARQPNAASWPHGSSRPRWHAARVVDRAHAVASRQAGADVSATIAP